MVVSRWDKIDNLILASIHDTAAKFNCTVPGTLTDFTEECNITTTVETQQATTLPLTTTTIAPPTTDSPSDSAGQTHMITLNAFMSVVVVMGLALVTTVAIIITLCCYIHTQRRLGVANRQMHEDALYSDLERIDRHTDNDHQITDQLETEGKLLEQSVKDNISVHIYSNSSSNKSNSNFSVHY